MFKDVGGVACTHFCDGQTEEQTDEWTGQKQYAFPR